MITKTWVLLFLLICFAYCGPSPCNSNRAARLAVTLVETVEDEEVLSEYDEVETLGKGSSSSKVSTSKSSSKSSSSNGKKSTSSNKQKIVPRKPFLLTRIYRAMKRYVAKIAQKVKNVFTGKSTPQPVKKAENGKQQKKSNKIPVKYNLSGGFSRRYTRRLFGGDDFGPYESLFNKTQTFVGTNGNTKVSLFWF